MVLLNFADLPASIDLPFPKQGPWTEMIDADSRSLTLPVQSDGEVHTVDVPSHYGYAFVWTAQSLP
jgi:hypothetical protein